MTKEQELRIVSFGYGPGHSDWEYLATELDVETFNKLAQGTQYVALEPDKWPYSTDGYEDDPEVRMLESGLNPVIDLGTDEGDCGTGSDWIYKTYGSVETSQYLDAWFQACRDQVTKDHVTYVQFQLKHVGGPLNGE